MQQKHTTSRDELNSWLNGRAATPGKDAITRDVIDRELPQEKVDRVKHGGSKTEQSFTKLLDGRRIPFRRTGFPDYAILDGPDAVPVGFIEVKRGPHDKRRFDQIAFERFCERFRIPYLLWWPGKPLPSWALAVAGSTQGTRVLRGNQTVSIPLRRLHKDGDPSSNGSPKLEEAASDVTVIAGTD